MTKYLMHSHVNSKRLSTDFAYLVRRASGRWQRRRQHARCPQVQHRSCHSTFRLQPTLRRIATSRGLRKHAVVCCDQRGARQDWFRKPFSLQVIQWHASRLVQDSALEYIRLCRLDYLRDRRMAQIELTGAIATNSYNDYARPQ